MVYLVPWVETNGRVSTPPHSPLAPLHRGHYHWLKHNWVVEAWKQFHCIPPTTYLSSVYVGYPELGFENRTTYSFAIRPRVFTSGQENLVQKEKVRPWVDNEKTRNFETRDENRETEDVECHIYIDFVGVCGKKEKGIPKVKETGDRIDNFDVIDTSPSLLTLYYRHL